MPAPCSAAASSLHRRLLVLAPAGRGQLQRRCQSTDGALHRVGAVSPRLGQHRGSTGSTCSTPPPAGALPRRRCSRSHARSVSAVEPAGPCRAPLHQRRRRQCDNERHLLRCRGWRYDDLYRVSGTVPRAAQPLSGCISPPPGTSAPPPTLRAHYSCAVPQGWSGCTPHR